MNLQPNKLLYGVAPEILVDCGIQLHRINGPFSFNQFCEALGAPMSEARPILEQMIKDEFMRPSDQEHEIYEPLQKLAQLALSHITEGITRTEAEKHLKSVVQKAQEINSNPEKYKCSVICLVVFGSYLTRKAVLGDLDIGVAIAEIAETPFDTAKFLDDLMHGVRSPTTKAKSSLRLRKPKQISIHDLREVIQMGTPYKIVLGDLPEEYKK